MNISSAKFNRSLLINFLFYYIIKIEIIWLTFKGTDIYIKNKLIHPEYKKFFHKRFPRRLLAVKNDFCLIETNTTMNFGRHVGKISIADKDFTTEGKWLILTLYKNPNEL